MHMTPIMVSQSRSRICRNSYVLSAVTVLKNIRKHGHALYAMQTLPARPHAVVRAGSQLSYIPM